MKKLMICALVLSLLLGGCSAEQGFERISQEEAARRMAEDADCLVVDVRTPEEYAEGHIPGAINVPNETIGSEAPAALPDKGQTLLVYCRSGRRSKEAAGKLAALGYTRVLEFGGIMDWTGEIVTEEATAMKLSINGAEVSVAWESNASVEALRALAARGPLTISMSMYGGFEQVGDLGAALPREDVQTTTQAGDIVLYAGDQLVVFYGSNSWAYTRLGRITDQTPEALREMLGNGNVEIVIE